MYLAGLRVYDRTFLVLSNVRVVLSALAEIVIVTVMLSLLL